MYMFRVGDEILNYMMTSETAPKKNYPLPGIYLKSYGYGFGLVLVEYDDQEKLVAIKLTGR